MKNLLAFVSVWGFALSLLAGEANFTKPELAPQEFGVQLATSIFVPPAKDAGTVNPHAIVCDITVIGPAGGTVPLTVAIDSSKPEISRPDVIRLDFSGKGNFGDAKILSLKTDPSVNRQIYQATFGPEVIQINRGQDVMPVLIQGRYFKSGEYRSISMQVLAALQGDVNFGKKTHAVRMVDCNANFNFSDAPLPLGYLDQYISIYMGDYLSIDMADNGFQKPMTVPLGQPVRIDGQWYKVVYEADKKQISASAVQIPTATIQHDQSLWICKLANKDRVLVLHGGKEPVEVPVGEYNLIEYKTGSGQNSVEESGMPVDSLLTIQGRNARTGKIQPIILAEGKTCTLNVGVPLQAKCIAKASGKDVTFNMQLADRNGSSVGSIYGPGGKLEKPKISVIDNSGATIYDNTLEFG